MNGERASIMSLLDALVAGVEPAASVPADSSVDMIVFPPAVYLDMVMQKLAGCSISVGMQNIHTAASGAYTGEHSAAMVADMGAKYVLVGHSERRMLFGETDQQVALKVKVAQEQGLMPVICVGETLAQRDAGNAETVVLQQLDSVIRELGCDCLKHALVAYEPVWAIGTGQTAGPDQAQAMHAAIRSWLFGQNASVAEELRILYGGSVTAENAEALFSQPDIDGGLVGGASLKAEEFLKIGRALSRPV